MRRFRRKAVVAVAGIERLELAEAGGDQPVRRDALLDQIADHGIARAADSSQLDGKSALVIGLMSVWPSTRSTQAMSGGICFSSCFSASASLSICGRASGFRSAEPESNSTSDGKDEAVADDLEVRAGAEHLAQLAEEVGAVARQLLHLLGERHVQPLAEIGDLHLALLVLGLGSVERLLQGGDLEAERRELLVEDLDLRERLVGDLLLLVELAGQLDGAGLGAFGLAACSPSRPVSRAVSLSLSISVACSAERLSSSDCFFERSSASNRSAATIAC